MTRLPRAMQSLLAVVFLWIGGRATIANWHVADEPVLVERESPARSQEKRSAPPFVSAAGSTRFEDRVAFPIAEDASPRVPIRSGALTSLSQNDRATPSAKHGYAQSPSRSLAPQGAPLSPPAAPLPLIMAANHWSGSAWLIHRPRGPVSALAPFSQLGGSQAGARIWRSFASSGRLTLGANVRASAALRSRSGREIAIGAGLRLAGKVPIELIAERRFGVGRGDRDGFALLAAGGVSDFQLPAGLLLSGYGQAGFVGLKRRDGFADAALRIERPLGGNLRLGLNAWGAVQPGTSRVDAGPSVALATQALDRPLRVSLEWRQRLSGNAAPGSGPALTLGTDF